MSTTDIGGQIVLDDVHVRLGSSAQAFDAVQGITLTLEAGAFTCLLGPSGCGKSTLLGAIAGHIHPTRGAVLVDGRPVAGPHPERGLVFQQHTLLPWAKVIDNVAFGPKMQGVGRRERRAQARAMLEIVDLADFADHYPSQLSGGMQQRAEIARVLINRPRVLLMDEPFGALDAMIRTQMQHHLLATWDRIRTTVVFITHDIDEALFLGDRLLIMSARPGRILADIPLSFPRPRTDALLTDPDFVALKARCLQLLGDHGHTSAAPIPRLSPLGGAGAKSKVKG